SGSSNAQAPDVTANGDLWSLRFGALLELGAWCLVLYASLAANIRSLPRLNTPTCLPSPRPSRLGPASLLQPEPLSLLPLPPLPLRIRMLRSPRQTPPYVPSPIPPTILKLFLPRPAL